MNKKFKVFFLVLFALSLILGICFRVSESFAEFYTLKIAPAVRVPLSVVTSPFPFSLGESAVLLLILLGAAVVISGIWCCASKLILKKYSGHFKVYFKAFFCSIAFIYFTYAFGFGSSYSRVPLSETMKLEKVDMNSENIVAALEEVTLELGKVAKDIEFMGGMATTSKMTLDELSDEMLGCARRAAEKYPFFQKHPFKAKPIAFSLPLAYTGISGVYSFFTGESNINTVFPEYTLPFTVAHEYSHQMGIGSEKEAEFSALLICLESDIPYVRYSAYSQVAITLLNILFEQDEEAFYGLFESLPPCLVNDIYLSSKSSQKYSETKIDEIAQAINDVYLTASGDEGVVSYSLSSRLYVSYFLRS